MFVCLEVMDLVVLTMLLAEKETSKMKGRWLFMYLFENKETEQLNLTGSWLLT